MFPDWRTAKLKFPIVPVRQPGGISSFQEKQNVGLKKTMTPVKLCVGVGYTARGNSATCGAKFKYDEMPRFSPFSFNYFLFSKTPAGVFWQLD
jgi:hypothetical protein